MAYTSTGTGHQTAGRLLFVGVAVRPATRAQRVNGLTRLPPTAPRAAGAPLGPRTARRASCVSKRASLQMAAGGGSGGGPEQRGFGFSLHAEQLNGRVAMFFFMVGLITEFASGQTMPQQIAYLFHTLGIV
ncbi:hypothetical protein CDCA_CDCA05G1597 [Cyanidium caldarium]|uniref:High light inducible protein n=1 Tax=Cyanidium caldarium TaxID=2771 RepID=A0AAV9ITZ3_CYACA|nr:hypothetical protein CDCA_CDCA05G1595 [Cyanidium caldarium]KAK4535572.1 hypothetical protein CDCA_CDCA05G1597 [Cyanidium caldarium]